MLFLLFVAQLCVIAQATQELSLINKAVECRIINHKSRQHLYVKAKGHHGLPQVRTKRIPTDVGEFPSDTLFLLKEKTRGFYTIKHVNTGLTLKASPETDNEQHMAVVADDDITDASTWSLTIGTDGLTTLIVNEENYAFMYADKKHVVRTALTRGELSEEEGIWSIFLTE